MLKLFINAVKIFLLFVIAAISFNYLKPEVFQGEPFVETSELMSISATSTPKVVVPAIQTKTAVFQKPVNAPAKSVATTTEKLVIVPGPLRVEKELTSKTTLTSQGIIAYTNSERAKNGNLTPLIENELLNKDAQIKLADMFARQYFEHVSPTGEGPADLAKAVGYQYVVVGENLALGNFEGDKGVVAAWMNSPGHRANILNTHFQEIGVAAGKGMYEGKETWLAVQSFGVPLSACPQSDSSLKAMIDIHNARISILRAQIDAKKAQIESTPVNDSNYNIYVNEYNALLPEHNNLVESNRTLVDSYNTQVRAFNECISVVGAH